MGAVNEEQFRRIQIWETILAHIERERQLFYNAKSVYVVHFDTQELLRKAVSALNAKLHVSKVFFKVQTGTMKEIRSKEDLQANAAFIKEGPDIYDGKTIANPGVQYDLVGKLVKET